MIMVSVVVVLAVVMIIIVAVLIINPATRIVILAHLLLPVRTILQFG